MLRIGCLLAIAIVLPAESLAQVIAVPEQGEIVENLATSEAAPSDTDQLVAIAPNGAELPASAPSVAVEVRTPSPEDRVHILTGFDRVSVYVPSPTTGMGVPHEMLVLRSELLCIGTCVLRLGVGDTYALNLGHTGPLGARSAARVSITERTVALDMRYESPRKKRLRRWLSIGALPVVGAIMMGVAVARGDAWCARHEAGYACDRANRHAPLFWSGVSVMATFPFVSYVPFLARGRTVVTVIESEN